MNIIFVFFCLCGCMPFFSFLICAETCIFKDISQQQCFNCTKAVLYEVKHSSNSVLNLCVSTLLFFAGHSTS